jgi:cell wall-associated NlpC family hydrolase
MPSPVPLLPVITFTVQVGAFVEAENAVRLARSLDAAGVEAFHFVGEDGLNRVRFGSFASREAASARAEALKAGAVIADYVVVAAGLVPAAARDGLRDDIARAALSFLGRPYRWGAAEGAFDCSGLTMTVYRLSGLGLPRSSAEQYVLGRPVSGDRLREADLVFFDTESRGQPDHVGLYVGDGRFVHAPGEGKVVRVDELASGWYARRFLAGRSYLE